MGTRHAAVAGQFYPARAAALRETVETYVKESGVDAAPERTLGILVPHAGYVYSGPTAGHAFARVRGKKVQRVVLLGRSHRYQFEGVSIYTSGAFETPLGALTIDEAFARELAARIGNTGLEPHLPEHGLEVELPFLQVVLGEVAIVPVLFGSDPGHWHVKAGETLAEMMAPEDLVLVSTDLSHYLNEDAANALDEGTLRTLLAKDWHAMVEGERQGACSMCGMTAVVAGMACALKRGAEDWRMWDYRTSAQASGDFSRVVGYGAVTMERAA
ncbi:MAG: AmmeMemoRadiSam system protein B [Candidatus Hydrogenedentes bacterium]|nr:AmmeMemoRadiSam system protein B [Candidatus Hydrogenedentota bacterium]